MMKMRLVSNWRQAWRWFSVQVFFVLAMAPLIWMELPDEAKALIPEAWRPWIITLVSVAGIMLRIKDQGGSGKGKGAGQ